MAIKNKTIQNISKDSDKRLLNEIWDRLQKIDTIRALDINNISIHVDDGEVLLLGHLVSDGHKQRIEKEISKIQGVISIKNQLISDRELISKVARALAKDSRTHKLILYVGAFHGWVHINGKVPLEKDRDLVEEVAASVPEVRGVVDLPKLVSGQKADKHHIIQPEIDNRVYDRTNSIGRVYRVIINPHNRLVIGVVVEADLPVNGHNEIGYFVVSSDFMKVVNEGGIILENSLPDLTSSPLFNQVEFIAPPEDWSPPYPYVSGEILWPKGISDV